MLTEPDKLAVLRAFVDQTFVRPNACATIDCDHIIAEIESLDAGKGRTDPFIENPGWCWIIDHLIAAKQGA